MEIASEPIGSSYHSRIFTRSYLISIFCKSLTFIIPLLILATISNVWRYSNLSLFSPQLSYENYKLSCLSTANTNIYDSSFLNDAGVINTISFLSVATPPNQIEINLVLLNGVKRCSLLLYFKLNLTTGIPRASYLTVVPLTFEFSNSTSNRIEKGLFSIQTNDVMPSSLVLSLSEYYLNGDPEIKAEFNANIEISYSKEINSSGNIYRGLFKVLPRLYEVETTLIENLRLFVPLLVFLCVPLWWWIIKPLLEWMLSNHIYPTRILHNKIKTQ